jgi:GT2 family glycosyltransferase
MVDVSVVIVSYNAVELLDDCIASVLERPDDGLTVEVIVVDNASSDGSAAHVRSSFPSVIVVESPENRGFAAGNNLGFERASGRHVLLLNSDARLLGDALGAMVRYLDAHPDIGQLGPRLRNPDGSLQRSARGFPTVWRLATEYLYLRKLAPKSRAFNAFYAGGFDYDHVADMDFLMGACLLVRRPALDAVGPMDERYFMYSEETDWARRFRDAGWRVTFFPGADVEHLGGGSTRKDWNRMYGEQVAGHLRFLATHESPRVAARARRLLVFSLRLRAGIYRTASLLLPSGRAARADRARQFAAARRRIAAIDVAQLAH